MATTKKNTAKKATVTTLSTVNVIVIQGVSPSQMVSFPDTQEGNANAERLFKEFAARWGVTDPDDLADALDNGFLELGEHDIYIVHSQDNLEV